MTCSFVNENMDWALTDEDRLMQRIQKLNPERFSQFCHMHLAFILDIPHFTPAAATLKRASTPFKKSRTVPVDFCLGQRKISRLFEMIEFLGLEQNVQQVGLFRKSGNVSRQNQLKKLLASQEPLQLNRNIYSSHDCATVLKTCLSELDEPLLGSTYYNAHCQIPDLRKENMNKDEAAKARANQVQALQLLFLLLPPVQRQLLQSLLSLLHKAAQDKDNRMDASSLGTMFAPHILCPKKVTADDLRQLTPNISKAVAFMIENAPLLFHVPHVLVTDLKAALAKERSSTETVVLPPDEVVTEIAFCERKGPESVESEKSTAQALAELYAHVQSMPDNPQKNQLVKQFNKENGTGTPRLNRRKRSKSICASTFASIKKHFLRKDVVKNRCSRKLDRNCNEKLLVPVHHVPKKVPCEKETTCRNDAKVPEAEISVICHPAYRRTYSSQPMLKETDL